MGTDGTIYRLESRACAFAARHAVLRSGERVLLMLSGGADSMALLDLAPRIDRRLGLGLTFAALHVDYRTRGADSTRDRHIVETACSAAGVPLHIDRLERHLGGGDFQARARELRYGRARELAGEHSYAAIVTAHNRDDQAETALYRIIKYASPRGLAGMRPRQGELARPLLGLGAAEIRAYCRDRGIEYGEDVTNARPVYARNVLRLEVLPLLARLNPRVVETLAAGAAQAAAEADVLDELAAAAAARVGACLAPGDVAALDVAALAAESPALRALVVHHALREALGGGALVERRLVESVLALAERRDDAGRVSLGSGLEATRGNGRLRLRRRPVLHACEPVTLAGIAFPAAAGEVVRLVWCGRAFRVRLLAGAVVERDAVQAFIALARRPQRVVLRHPRRGERFAPLGLPGETTVARYLAAARVPQALRGRTLALEVDGAIAWVAYDRGDGALCGRVARPFRVQESTATTLHVIQEGV